MKEDGTDMAIMLYGAGRRCHKVIDFMTTCGYTIIAVFDKDEKKHGDKIDGYTIRHPKDVMMYKDYRLCITIVDQQQMISAYRMLDREYSFPVSNIVSFYQLKNEIITKTIIVNDVLAGTGPRYRDEWTVVFGSENAFGLGGIESWTKDVSTGVSKQHNVRILSRKKENVSYKTDIRIDYVGEHGDGDVCRLIKLFIKYFADLLPAVFISSQPNEELIAACMLKEYFPDRLKIISVVHGDTEDIYDRYGLAYGKTDLFIGVSKKIGTELQKRVRENNRVQVITCPVYCEQELKREYTIDRKRPIRIGYAGRIENNQKRIDLIVQLASYLQNKAVNMKIDIAGNGSMYDSVNKTIESENLGSIVTLCGEISRDRIPDFWQKKDIAINLSDYEGHSISQMEAMANGAVPVVTRVSGAEDDIHDGMNGFIVSLGDYREAAERIIDLENNRSLLQRMGAAAHNEIKGKSSLNEHIKYWISTIDRMIEENT